MDEYHHYYDDESDDGIWYFEGGIEEIEFRVYGGGIKDVAINVLASISMNFVVYLASIIHTFHLLNILGLIVQIDLVEKSIENTSDSSAKFNSISNMPQFIFIFQPKRVKLLFVPSNILKDQILFAYVLDMVWTS